MNTHMHTDMYTHQQTFVYTFCNWQHFIFRFFLNMAVFFVLSLSSKTVSNAIRVQTTLDFKQYIYMYVITCLDTVIIREPYTLLNSFTFVLSLKWLFIDLLFQEGIKFHHRVTKSVHTFNDWKWLKKLCWVIFMRFLQAEPYCQKVILAWIYC